MTTALLDADIIVHKSCWTSTTEIAWDDGDPSVAASLSQAKKAAEYLIDKWRKAVKARRYFLCFSDANQNFRKGIDETYKAHRKAKSPETLVPLRDYLKEKHPVLEIPTLEADDVMGIYATNGQLD